MLLSEIFNIEILSCDSRQFYKELNIGTSSPNKEILENIKHYFIGHLSIWKCYSAGDYQKDVFKKLNELFTRFPIILMVGGSGLYSKVITYGINYLPFISKEISRDLNIKIPFSICFKHSHKFIRSIEIMNISNRNLFSFHKKIIMSYSFYIFIIGLNLPRYDLYDKINQRVESMIKCGFLEEAQEYYHCRYLNALQSIGYIDIFNFFDEKISFDKTIEKIKKNTRRYAKRQLTWFKKGKKIKWFFSCKENEIIKFIKKYITYIKSKMS